MSLTTSQQTDLYKLAAGMYAASPGVVYMNQLANAVISGVTIAQLYDILTGSSSFQSQNFAYTNSSTDAQFSTYFCNKILGTTVTSANMTVAIGFVTNLITANGGGTHGRAVAMKTAIDALYSVASSDTNFGKAHDLFANQITVAQYYTEVQGGSATSISALQSTLTLVTSDSTSVQTAEAANASTAGNSFTLTKSDAVLTDTSSASVTPTGVFLSNANDTVDALNLLSSSVVIKDPSTTDSDVLKGIVGAVTITPLIVNMETVDIQFTDATGNVAFTNITGAKFASINASSTTAGTFSALSPTAGPTIILNSTKTLTVVQTDNVGTTDVLNVTVNGVKGGLSINDGVAGGTLETLNISSSGTASNSLTLAVDGTNTVAVSKVVVTGSQDLTIIGTTTNGQISGTNKIQGIDASGLTGKLTLQVGASSSDTTITDNSISLSGHKSISAVTLNDTDVVTVSNASKGLTVNLNSDGAFATMTISGSSSVSDAASNADTLTVNLTGATTAGTSSNIGGALTFTGFETLNVKSTGINHTITGALTTTGSATALDTVNISGDKDLTLGAAPSGVEKLDATGFTGKLIMTAAGTALLTLTGGDGNDTLYSGGNTTSATVVNAGAGNDTIVLGSAKDDDTGGAGNDIFNITTLAWIVRGNGDIIRDFTSGTDQFKVGATVQAATTTATLTLQELTFATSTAATIGTGTYTANAASLIKITNDGGTTGAVAYYLIVNDGTAAYADGTDGVIKLSGVTALTTADFIA